MEATNEIKHYDLFLDLDFTNLRYSGKVQLELETESDVILNSVGLRIIRVIAEGKTFSFRHQDEDLIIETGPFKGVLVVEYEADIPDTLVGIYRAPYEDTYMITTQFEAPHARRMFPCLDNPNHKAEFTLKVRVDKDLSAISNMPIKSVNLDGDTKVVEFLKTPRMSTYLLYLGVGKYDELADEVDGIEIIAATTPGKADKTRYAVDVTKKSLQFYSSYFGMPYVLPKLHLIAVPEFASGAMENWGAITFRELALFIDQYSSVRTRKRVAEVVAHELTHQWFGNLVTMEWWDELWLNESFATYMAYKAVDALYPEWNVWYDFLNADTAGAMARDSLKNTHPIEAQIKSPHEIEEIFDDISYGKGASVLRMIETYIGSTEFMKGIQLFLKRHRFSNATGKNLWACLEETSSEAVTKIMSEWVQKPGYPQVTAKMNGEKLILRQERFLLSGESTTSYYADCATIFVSDDETWPIPLTLIINGQARSILLDKKESSIDVGALNSLKINVDRTGFYRVYFDGLYEQVLESNLSPLDRQGIISDALAFLTSRKMTIDEYLGLVEKYHEEKDYLPALEVSDQLAFLRTIIPSKVIEISKKFHRTQLRILELKTDENSVMLRGIMASRLAMVDDDYANELGGHFDNYDKTDPNMRDAVLIAYARAYPNFESIVEKYRGTDSDEERVRFLSALVSLKDPALVAQSLGFALSGEVKRQDVRTMIVVATRNTEAREVSWSWLKFNLSKLRKLYEGTAAMSRVLLSVIPILGIGNVEEVEMFFSQNKVPEAEKGILAGLERLRIYNNLVESL